MASSIEPKPSLMGSAAAFSDSSDRSDALSCPIVPLAMQTLVGTCCNSPVRLANIVSAKRPKKLTYLCG